MIELMFWPTPNGKKITIMLEETGLPYTISPVNIDRGEQFRPEFLRISPNNRIPAIVDHDPPGGGERVSVFESGAILVYLAEKSGKLLPADLRGRSETLSWVAWQVSGLGPMTGQLAFFKNYASERIPFAVNRYDNEVHRLLGVLDRRLQDREYIAGDYSVADVACFPWVMPAFAPIADFPHVKRWYEAVGQRPAVKRAALVGAELRGGKTVPPEEAKAILFGQRGPRSPTA